VDDGVAVEYRLWRPIDESGDFPLMYFPWTASIRNYPSADPPALPPGYPGPRRRGRGVSYRNRIHKELLATAEVKDVLAHRRILKEDREELTGVMRVDRGYYSGVRLLAQCANLGLME
jgi:hypothetical protein